MVTLLHRINVEKNEARFYMVQVGPSLLEQHCVLRIWGRIGGHQRSMISSCDSDEDAQRLADRVVRRRLKRGYQIVNVNGGQNGLHS